MAKRTEAQLAHSELIDTLRTLVRLKHRAQMRRELNELEDDAIRELERRIAAGEPYTPDIAGIVESGVGE